MRPLRFRLTWLMPTLLLGCQTGAPSPEVAARNTEQPSARNEVPPPDLSEESKLSLHLWDRKLKVGDASEIAANIFPERTLESNDLPSRFGTSYRARIWEKDTDGFGVILHNGRVAAAFAQFDNISGERVNDTLGDIRQRMPDIQPTFVVGRHTSYWFWEDANDRLMLCELVIGRLTHMTIALGNKAVMDALGASPGMANRDAKRVDELLQVENSETTERR